jgi:hypothetical protein
VTVSATVLLTTTFVLASSAACGRLGFEVGSKLSDASQDSDQNTICAAFDEDCDGVANLIDNCPTVANRDQLDLQEVQNGALADGVGDACDPLPTLAGDYIRLFNGFDADVSAAELQFYSRAQLQDGTLLLGATVGVGTTGSAEVPRIVKLSRAEFTFDVVSTFTTGDIWSGFWYTASDRNPIKNATFANVSDRDGRDLEAEIKEQTSTTTLYSNSLSLDPAFNIGDRFRIQIDTRLATGVSDQMTLTTRGVDYKATILISEPNQDNSRPYLESNRMVSAYRYLIIYAIR